MDLLWTILIGIAAGFLASHFMNAGGYGLLGYLVVGVLGAILGGFLFSILGVTIAIAGRLITATVGAMLLIAVLRALQRKTRR